MNRVPLPADVPADVAAQVAAGGQEHLFADWNRLDARGRADLLEQLRSIDWSLFAELRRRILDEHATSAVVPDGGDLTAAVTPPCLRLRDDASAIPPAKATACGTAALAAGRIGAILVAGGQASRLGCDGPKGIVPVGPVSGASLFEILLGKLVAVAARHGADVPLAIMTSSATDAATRAFLAHHHWFGLRPDRVLVFRQRDLPALSAVTGDLLRDGPGHVAMSPDGHGGMLGGLVAAGGLEWFRGQGVEHVVSFQVDNPLAMPLDSEFLGYHLLDDSEFTPQVVRKIRPSERVGVVVAVNGATRIVEYSDLPEELATARLADGRLRFHAGSIAVHAFALSFLSRCSTRADALPLHMAHKAVPCLDAEGRLIRPAVPNAWKFERFIFDLLPLARRVALVEIDADEGFAPLKNAPGGAADTAAHVSAAMIAHATRLLTRAGIVVAEGIPVELAADRIIDERDVAGLLPPGSVIRHPCFVGGRASP
jgi:UDP-N-acetylglucosamine/UDP-N-acetylgalactosamine diphosphorylase